MKLLPRKMTFQLTPLLDLLLIVIFAQFMEVRDTTSRSEAARDAREAEMREQIELEAAELKEQLQLEHAAKLNDLQEQRRRYREALRSILRQQEEAGKVLADAFDVPEETVSRLLKLDPNSSANVRRTAEELSATLQELQKASGRELLRMLISYSEMRKRCDIWEVHISDEDVIEFDNGTEVRSFRAGREPEIEDRLFEAYKTFGEPRTLVILLFSYGDASAGVRQRTEDALPAAVARMRADSGGRHWFEFAVLGFSPDGPSLREAKE